MFEESGEVKQLNKTKLFLKTALATAVALTLTGCADKNFGKKVQGHSVVCETVAPTANNTEYMVKITNVEEVKTGTNPNILKITLANGTKIQIELYFSDELPKIGDDIVVGKDFIAKTSNSGEPAIYRIIEEKKCVQ